MRWKNKLSKYVNEINSFVEISHLTKDYSEFNGVLGFNNSDI